ncbi:hypothetical protein Ahy_A05g022863 [Arachis hypogaea]|uniref:Pentatricopeptide repeat-containing protein n=1 Tax=Arachis hypogaea TaxID=3818 RepID=A0A445D1T5_ARAHY|nr:hypothetical protein Ahy_A05g022863 [Arachis hypogaea]
MSVWFGHQSISKQIFFCINISLALILVCSFVHLNLCHKNLVPTTVTYNTLIDDGLGKSKRISRALELFIEMHDKGCLRMGDVGLQISNAGS